MSLFKDQPPPAQPVASLKTGQTVDWYYRILEINKRKKRENRGEYLSLLLMDGSGRIEAKVWDNIEIIGKLIQPNVICRIKGEVTEFQGKKQITVSQLRAVREGEPGLVESDFVEKPTFNLEETFAHMMAFLRSQITHPQLQRLLDLFTERHGAAFKSQYGAQKIHHAYLGGLLEHTDAVVHLAGQMADFYGLDRELLLIGALFHDLGKIAEFELTPAIDTTLNGGLLGHIVIGHRLFMELQNGIPGFDQTLSAKIQHLIISHHGEKEFGSPEVPKTPEAYVLHIVDLLDSRLNIFRDVAKKADGQRLFSEFQPTLGTRILIDREKG